MEPDLKHFVCKAHEIIYDEAVKDTVNLWNGGCITARNT